jgi:plasmid stabilization system protein ParE
MVQLNWTLQAKEDLRSIAIFIPKDSKNYAKREVKSIRDRIKTLKSRIRMVCAVPEINKEQIREIIERKYRIIYRIIDESKIDILTIRYQSRDFLIEDQ